MTPISVDGGTKAQKGQSYLAKISQPAKTKASGPSGTRVVSYSSQHTLSGVGTLWAQEGGGAFLEAQVGDHAEPFPQQGDLCSAEVTYGREAGPCTQSSCHTPSRYPRHFWNLPARPQQVPATSCQSGHLQGKDVRAGRPEGRGPPPLTPLFPFQPRPTNCLASQHPPSFQAHLLSVQPPGPPHQSHTTLSQALPTVLGKSVLQQPLLTAPGQHADVPSTDWH